MSAENLALLRGIYDRWAIGDFKTEDRVDPSFSLTMGPDFPDTGVHAGREGLAAYMKGFLEPWERITIEAEEMIDSGDRVLVRVLQAGTGNSSGIPVELRYFQLWTFEGPTPVAMETIMHEPDARARLERG
jgi:ketosteroid isomerase-like protein